MVTTCGCIQLSVDRCETLISGVMELKMLRFVTPSLWKAVFLLSLLTGERGNADSICKSRRCLAEMLIKRGFLSQPQNENCTQTIHMPFLEYQTLSVDTKNLHLYSRLEANLEWKDHELAWNMSDYPYERVVLPVTKIWTPELRVTNAIKTAMKHTSHDVLVQNDGTVSHTVTINAEVNCEVNLFNYPFAFDSCPIAIQTWSSWDCGTELELGYLYMVDSTHGDWKTTSASFLQQGYGQNYIWVQLSIKHLNPFITLMLPSILIVLADMVSFALPLGGGERNSFKVTLVLSFTMFLIILNDELPGDSQCSPIIRTHFCVCLILLVVSMLVSMVMTRMAKDGILTFCCFTKGSFTKKGKRNKEKREDEEAKADISVIQLDASDEHGPMLRKVVNFLEDISTKELESEKHQKLANTLDRIFFWLYFIFGSIYFAAMIYVMVNYQCQVNHFNFWYDYPQK